MPCHLSPELTETAGLHETSVTVLATMPPAAVEIWHVPLSAFAESEISTQCPAKYAGTSTARSVASVVPLDPACATPLPSDGSSVACTIATPRLSMTRSPYTADSPFRYTVPAPP